MLSPWDHVGGNGSVMFTSMRHGRWPRGIVPFLITGSIGKSLVTVRKQLFDMRRARSRLRTSAHIQSRLGERKI